MVGIFQTDQSIRDSHLFSLILIANQTSLCARIPRVFRDRQSVMVLMTVATKKTRITAVRNHYQIITLSN